MHYTFIFTGYSVEIYRNGTLATFTKIGGKINKSIKALTMGRKDEGTSDYTYQGAVDEVRLYDKALDVKTIAELPSIFENINADNVEIKSLIVNGVEWKIEDQYMLACDNSKTSIEVAIEGFGGAKISQDKFEVDVTKPSVQNIKFTITSEDGLVKKDYTLKVEVPFKSSDIISQKWNKVLTVNNNLNTNGGFVFTDYEWFKNGVSVSKKQYYSAGNKADEVLSPADVYSVAMKMNEGDEIHVCPFQVLAQKTVSVNVYPNQVRIGEKICIDAQMETDMLKNSNVDIYSLEGNFIKKINMTDPKTYFDMSESGVYVLKYQSIGGFEDSFKLIVK